MQNLNLKKEKIFSIIVTFEPQLENFKKIVKQHQKNFNHLIIVNNSPEINLSSLQSNEIIIINNTNNLGLATGLNIGIAESKKQGAQMVALFDQDTLLPDNFCHEMLRGINRYKSVKPPALFSPIFFNKITDNYGLMINFKPFLLVRSKPNQEKTYIYPQYVITSGSFIPISVINDVGLMRDELFIDFIDIEWCLRASKRGFQIVVLPKIEIIHYLGDSSISFFGLKFPIHSPLRMYYFFRNAIYLYRFKDIDWNWRLVDATRNIFRFLFYLFFVKNRLTYLRYILLGYYHGLIKKMGKLEEKSSSEV